MDISRRRFLQTSLAFSALTLLPACSLSRRAPFHHGRFVYEMTAEPATAEV
ncbi:multicopper oxidase family protein, partial [Vibrio vulnificus]|nr:multicopper oxidase family protein [Vibrio vulnificus]EIJ0948674.1 twin-arginine translocation signal domain-containing protein [Vibrio vulnificus]EJD0677040.1 twin-arginine translocation signal domain-containing protein [Vibrio vulnificus]EJZ7973488.1 twin-arginine translocation signal domain-containing protein [Vibrio vulnificus]